MKRIPEMMALLIAGAAQAQPVDPTQLVGRWAGAGRLFDVKVQAEHGPMPLRLQIAPDLTLTGTVGGVAIRPSQGKPVNERIDFHAHLDGPVRPEGALKKDHLVLLVTQADGQAMQADFHLKTNFSWDFSMRVGHLVATKAD